MNDTQVGQARLLVIGLDAATFRVCSPLLAKGEMPNLARLIERGATGVMESTVPPLSPAAWVTAMTGLNPGSHGVFDFLHLDLKKIHGRGSEMVTSDQYRGSTIFDILTERSLRTGAFNIPLTFPPWQVNGVMVSGPITPDLRKAYTYPPNLAGQLGAMGHHSSPEHLKSFDVGRYFKELVSVTKDHFRYGVKLLEESGPFDLFWFHLHTLDSVQHRFWRYSPYQSDRNSLETSSPYADAIQNFYRLADEGIGELLSRIGPGSYVIVLSDHGATGRGQQDFHINAMLRREGWLETYREYPGKRYVKAFHRRYKDLFENQSDKLFRDSLIKTGVNWQRTTAHGFHLADPIGGIVLNRNNIEGDEYDSIRSRMKDWLFSLKDPKSKKPIIVNVWQREELCSGSNLNQAPDILFQAAEQYHIGSNIDGAGICQSDSLDDPEAWSGVHAMDGIVILAGPQILPGSQVSNASLTDIVPTLLYCLGEALPNNLDGKPWLHLFDETYRKANEVAYSEPGNIRLEEQTSLDADEEEGMLSQLRSLGYIE